MYVSSTAPIPQNSMSPMDPVKSARYNARKNRVFQSVMWAASRYACTSPMDSGSFQSFGPNLQYEVQRAQNLLNVVGSGLSPQQMTQASVSKTGTSNAPSVIPLNPVDTNPKPKATVKPLGPWDTPQWGDSSSQLTPLCTPGASLLQAMQDHPWWTVGALAAVALATGALGTTARRRRAA